MAQYKQKFCGEYVHMQQERYYDDIGYQRADTTFTKKNGTFERSIYAKSNAQAFRIAQSIAKKNAWTVSGEPVKIN